MARYLKILGIVIIIIACYLGIRYVGSIIHYGCSNPAEDGPPPICLTGELGWVITGGNLVPLWRRDIEAAPLN